MGKRKDEEQHEGSSMVGGGWMGMGMGLVCVTVRLIIMVRKRGAKVPNERSVTDGNDCHYPPGSSTRTLRGQVGSRQ